MFYLAVTVTKDTFEYDLYQTRAVDEKLMWPVYFANRLIEDPETRYSFKEKHVACLVAGVKKFHHYLVGTKKFKILTTHLPLVQLMTLPEPTGRTGKWIMSLVRYNFDIISKGITFVKVEAGLCNYEVRDLTCMPNFAEATRNLETVINKEDVQKELERQHRRLQAAKSSISYTEEWVQRQKDEGKSELEIMEAAWGKVLVRHAKWKGWNLWFDGAVQKGNMAAGGVVLQDRKVEQSCSEVLLCLESTPAMRLSTLL